jgi:rhomboid protease GluP
VGVNDDTCYNCGRRNPGLWGFAPALRSLGGDMGFVPFVIGACIVLFILTLIASQGTIGMGGLFSFMAPSRQSLFLFGASGAIPVFVADRWWTVLSAGWLHGGAIHILFNMMAVRQLAPATADLYGPGRMVIIYIAGGVAGFTLSSVAGEYVPAILFLRGGSLTVGASASIAGLIGAILYYGHRSGSSMARSYASTYVLMLVFMGFLMAGIDNYAHAGGFGGPRCHRSRVPRRVVALGRGFGPARITVLRVSDRYAGQNESQHSRNEPHSGSIPDESPMTNHESQMS